MLSTTKSGYEWMFLADDLQTAVVIHPLSCVLLFKLWIYENHVCEQRSEEWYEGRSSQLYTQLLQWRKKRLKKILFEWNLPAIFSSFTKSTEPTATLSPGLPSWRGLCYLSVICLINDLVITRGTRLFAVLKLLWTAQRGSCTWA